MADGRVSYPSVFVVDGGMNLPPALPPKPGQRRIQNRRRHLIQNILLVLVFLVLCGLIVEGCLIYQLHNSTSTNQTSQSNTSQRQGQGQTSARKGPRGEKPVTERLTFQQPSKPLAHLSAGSQKPEGAGIMKWNTIGNYILHEFNYSDGKLIVQKEGFYYVYSKLSYSADCCSFVQTVQVHTSRLLNKPIQLLTYSAHSLKPVHKATLRNTYLGGVFHLYKGDAVFVHVNNGSLVRLHNPSDNFFGMFML